jgi:cyclopropane fatty-acyl-phospholipid synthase-like methyltransferase
MSVTGTTASGNQVAATRERCLGLPVDIQLCDYRSLQGRFDRIFWLGVFEHAGLRNYVAYFQTARRLRSDDDLMLLHINERWLEISNNHRARFHRMWNFWLSVSAAYFRARCNQLWQVVLSPEGVPAAIRKFAKSKLY